MTSFALKLVLCLSVLIGNMGLVLVDGEKYTLVYQLMRMVGAMAVPIACFLLVEGFHHTSSKKTYFIRLFFCGVIAELPYLGCSLMGLRKLVLELEECIGKDTMPNYDSMKQLAEIKKDGTMPYFTDLYNTTAKYAVDGLIALSFMLLVLMLIDRLREKYAQENKTKFTVLSSLTLLGALVMIVVIPFESPLPILFFTAVFYFLRGNKAGIAVMSVLLISFFYMDAGMIITLGPIMGVLICFAYNGKQGEKGFNKFFYIMYPLQYMLIWGTNYFVLK